MRQTGLPDVVEEVLSGTTPMKGRMIHMRKQGQYTMEPQLYDARGKNLLALDRTSLNKTLLDRLEAMPNVTFFFNYKLTGVDFNKKLVWLERHHKDDPPRGTELEKTFDFMIGADGAHSAVRYHLMKFVPMTYQQEYIDKLWCQFDVPASKTGDYRIPPNYLHIWPQDDSMFIALPNRDKTFTSTLFLSRAGFDILTSKGSSAIVAFFQDKFPGVVPDLITEEELVTQFTQNPHLPLITINCTPYHYRSTGVIVGDAAHAMVPFYGQGMNAGLESVRVLFDFLDAHPATPAGRAEALAEYSAYRTPDAKTINELALRNYNEMATHVKSPLYLLRKRVEEILDVHLPTAGWATMYSRVTFSNMRYSEVRARERWQARVLNGVVAGLGAGALGVLIWGVRRGWMRKTVGRGICWVARRLQRVFG
jgi:kynurenine 3-monooxygenase